MGSQAGPDSRRAGRDAGRQHPCGVALGHVGGLPAPAMLGSQIQRSAGSSTTT